MSDGSAGGVGSNDLPEVLDEIWNRVVKQVNKLLEAHNSFGFVHFNAMLNPSLADVINGFTFIDFALSKLVDSGRLQPEEAMSAINSRQCILKMKSLSIALSAGDNAGYERIIHELKMHAG